MIHSRAHAARQRGFAVLMVIWLLGVMLALLAQTTNARRWHSLLTRNVTDITQAQLWAEGGIEIGLRQLVTGEYSGNTELASDDVGISVGIRNEAGRIDLNFAPEELIRGLLVALGHDQSMAQRLSDTILDWRDIDDLRRPFGAEDDDYARLGLPHGRNGPFTSVYELLRVAGITPEIFVQLRDHVTVHARSREIYPPDATAAVLLAVPGSSLDMVEEYIRRRQDPGTEPFAIGDRRYVTDNPPRVYEIHSGARLRNGIRYEIRSVATTDPRRADGPYAILDVRYGPELLIATNGSGI